MRGTYNSCSLGNQLAAEKLTDPLEIRRYMADQGWRSRDSIDFDGASWSYVIWFYRRDWHGTWINEPVEVSAHSGLDATGETVRRAAREAAQLWKTFPDKVPGRFFDSAENKHIWSALPENQQPEEFRS